MPAASSATQLLTDSLTTEVLSEFLRPGVTDLAVQPDGTVLLKHAGTWSLLPVRLNTPAIFTFLNAAASANNQPFDDASPALQLRLPAEIGNARLQGFREPLTTQPCFTLRRPPDTAYSFTDLEGQGVLATAQSTCLRQQLANRKNIIIVGATGSGKTTFLTTLLRDAISASPLERVVVLEDTPEVLLDNAPNVLALTTTTTQTLADLVRHALRSTPDRIVVGEVRGTEAFDLLNAFSTGHPGGLATLHAEHPLGALTRLMALVQRSTGLRSKDPEFVTGAVDVIAVIRATPERRLTHLVRPRLLTSDPPSFSFEDL